MASEFAAFCYQTIDGATETTASIDLKANRYRNYSAVKNLCHQLEHFRRKPDPLVYSQGDAVSSEWLSGLGSALVIPLRRSDGTVSGLILFGDRKPHPLPYDDEDEKTGAKDFAALLGSALEAREAQKEREQLQVGYEGAIRAGAAGLFGSLVIHQLNTGLTDIQWNLDLMREVPEKRDEWLFAIVQQKDQLEKLVLELASRPSAGRRTEQLRLIVNLALKIARTPSPEKNVATKIDNKEDELVIVADLWQIVLGVVNVLDNAADHVNAEGRIEVISTLEGDFGVIRVRNTGPVPTAETKEKMFQHGYSTKPVERGRGLGVGLSLAKQAFETAGGQISFQEQDGMNEMVMKLQLTRHNPGSAR
jgi:signal transduction histidine kinase